MGEQKNYSCDRIKRCTVHLAKCERKNVFNTNLQVHQLEQQQHDVCKTHNPYGLKRHADLTSTIDENGAEVCQDCPLPSAFCLKPSQVKNECDKMWP